MRLSLYLHIPFCVKKCLYCDFLSFPTGSGNNREKEKRYLARLAEEIKEKSVNYKECLVDTIFIGGGTPSVLEEGEMAALMEVVKDCFSLEKEGEYSVEVNPGTVTKEKLREYRECGLNRISIGAQSLKDKELELLGRIHTREDFFTCYEEAQKAGFTNINVDCMSALPGQKVRDYLENLEEMVRLGPTHISAYSLIIEENTPFYNLYSTKEGQKMLPTEEEDREMYHKAGELLKKKGYRRYEISNYALPGYECKHNLGYWSGKNYLGLGLGAASMVEHVRWKNTESFSEYMETKAVERDRIVLSPNMQMEEFMFLGLRKIQGVSKKEFSERFTVPMEAIYGDWISKMKRENLLLEGENLFLTERGLDLANYVMAGFLLEEE